MDFKSPPLDLPFPQSHKPLKNISGLLGIFLRKLEVIRPSRDAQNLCAAAKEEPSLKGRYHGVFDLFFENGEIRP